MARYFIDTSDGTVDLRDGAGAEFPSVGFACAEARRAVHDMVRDHVARGGSGTLTALVRSEDGRTVYHVGVTFSESFGQPD